MTNQPGKAKPPSSQDLTFTAELVESMRYTCDPTNTALDLLVEALQADPAAPAVDVLNHIGCHTAEDLWRVIQVCTTSAAAMALKWATDKNSFDALGPDDGGSAFVVEVARMWRRIPPSEAPA